MSYSKQYAQKCLLGTSLKPTDKAFIQKLAQLTNSTPSAILRSLVEEGLNNLRGKD